MPCRHGVHDYVWCEQCSGPYRGAVERYLPCPDCRDKVQGGECQRCARQRAEGEVERLTAENERLTDEIAQREEAYRTVIDERGAPDERHCTCVPHLRAENACLTTRVEELEGARERFARAVQTALAGGASMESNPTAIAAVVNLAIRYAREARAVVGGL